MSICPWDSIPGKEPKVRRMYFRDGKLISKSTYDASRKRRGRSTKKGMRRKTARRAYMGQNDQGEI